MDSFIKGIFVVGVGCLAAYAINSYGYQKEIEGYKNGVLATAVAYEKKYDLKAKEENE